VTGDRRGGLATAGRAEEEERAVVVGTSDRPADLGSNRRLQEILHKNRNGLTPRQKVLVGLEVFVSLCGLGGGVYMATHPLTTMSLHYLQGTWFHTWRWPGLALALFVGVCPALVVGATVLGRREAAIGHLCVGVGLVAWVSLEAAWIVSSPGLQTAFGAIGGLIIVLALVDMVHADHDPEPASGG
jgi:hypothetical protein